LSSQDQISKNGSGERSGAVSASEPLPARIVSSIYADPIELIWTDAAKKLGMTVVRCPEVYAAWDGHGTLRIGTPNTLDPDDSLAQLVLHECCHALVVGPDGFSKEDWGLAYEDPGHVVFEQAALIIQARLADAFGLRNFLASTTDFRAYFDRIGIDPLDFADNTVLELASEAWNRSRREPWHSVLSDALRATAEIAKIIRRIATPESLWSTVEDI
jgi:hypothetical protein